MPPRRAALCALLVLVMLFAALGWRLPAESVPAAQPQPRPRPAPAAPSAALSPLWVRQFRPQQPAWPDQPRFQSDAAPCPVAVGRRLLVASARDDAVYALDSDSGAVVWRFDAGGPVRFAPAVHRDRVYVADDAGFLTCLDLDTGRTLWAFRGAPSNRKVLGNGRLISAWPARGGPAVADEADGSATVYFAAGVWPFMGVFLYALDADTGAVRWLNDGDGSLFIRQPHQAEAFAGVAPQGSLVVVGDRLLVPGGRSVPACYDRRTGKLLHYRLADNSKLGGGPEVLSDGVRFVNGGGVFEVATGKFVASTGAPAVFAGGRLCSVVGGAVRDDAEQPAPSALKSALSPGSGIEALVADGGRLYAGAPGRVCAYDLPLRPGAAPIWRTAVEGRPVRLVAADGRLFVSTREGRVYAFGPATGRTPSFPLSDVPAPVSDPWTERAAALLDAAAVRDGYCVAWGAGSGRLVTELLRQSRLHVLVVERDAERAAALRAELTAGGWYGERASVLCEPPLRAGLPPYLCALMVSEDWEQAGLSADEETLSVLFASLRPFGGVACLDVPRSDRARLASRLANGVLPQARLRDAGDWLLLSRDGPIPGSADWTHEHADAANTRVSKDRVVKAPLGLLWFGGSTNEGVLPRHGHGPQPQTLDGRLFLEGVDALRALDLYTGRPLWETRLPGLGKVYDNESHQPGANAAGSNFVTTREGLYVAHGSRCVRLDPATGAETAEYRLPAFPDTPPRPEWSFLTVYDRYLIGGTNPPPTSPKARATAVSSSKYLAVFDRRTGRLLHRLTAESGFRHNAVCAGNGKLFVIDRDSDDFLDFLNRKKADKKPGRVAAYDLTTGKELWRRRDADVFGTWLSYSEACDVLVESGRNARDTLKDEPTGMRAYRGGDGGVLWFRKEYAGPAMLHGERVLRGDGGACDLKTGAPYLCDDPLTGQKVEWKWSRTYGCNTPMASENLLTFRSGAAGYYDLCGEGGTGNFGGFRSGCTNNLVVAGGVLCAPDYTRTCTCSYQQQTSLALVPMPDAEMWTFHGGPAEVKGRIQRVGVLLGAPGNRRDADGTLWVEYPKTGGPGPRPEVKTEPATPDYFRHNAARVEGAESWKAASGARDLRKLTLALGGPADASGTYTVRLHFVEPDGLPAGRRVFDVAIGGKTVLRGLDVSAEAGGPGRALVKEFRGVRLGRELTVTLTPAAGSAAPPVLCGVDLRTEV